MLFRSVTEMPALFERFVESELTAALHGHCGRLLDNPVVDLSSGTEADGDDGTTGGRHRASGGRHRAPAGGSGDHISVRTGLVYEVDGDPVTTFVATYPTDRRARAAEHYRLLAACTALGVERAYLIYPAQRRDDAPQPRRIVHTDISIVEYPVDLAEGPAHSSRAIVELARQARELAAETTARRRTGARHRTEGRRHAR